MTSNVEVRVETHFSTGILEVSWLGVTISAGFSGMGVATVACVGVEVCDMGWVVARGPEGVEVGPCDDRGGTLGPPF